MKTQTAQTAQTEELTGKALEISLIEQLFEANGYFAYEFAEGSIQDDFGKMTNNIKSDFPIFLGTTLGDKIERVDSLVKEVRELKAQLDVRVNLINDLTERLTAEQGRNLGILNKMLTSMGAVEPEDFFTQQEIIYGKLKAGVGFTEEEAKAVSTALTMVW